MRIQLHEMMVILQIMKNYLHIKQLLKMPLMEMEHIKHGLLTHGVVIFLELHMDQMNGLLQEHLIKVKRNSHIIQEELILIVQITLILDI
jgi:hypothetical protein